MDPTADPEKRISPLEKQLLSDLRAAGAAGLEPRYLKFRGAAEGLSRLAELGLATAMEGGAYGDIYYAAETYRKLRDTLLGGRHPGERLTITAARERTGLSRKYLLPLLNRLEADGYLKRREEDREILRVEPG